MQHSVTGTWQPAGRPSGQVWRHEREPQGVVCRLVVQEIAGADVAEAPRAIVSLGRATSPVPCHRRKAGMATGWRTRSPDTVKRPHATVARRLVRIGYVTPGFERPDIQVSAARRPRVTRCAKRRIAGTPHQGPTHAPDADSINSDEGRDASTGPSRVGAGTLAVLARIGTATRRRGATTWRAHRSHTGCSTSGGSPSLTGRRVRNRRCRGR